MEKEMYDDNTVNEVSGDNLHCPFCGNEDISFSDYFDDNGITQTKEIECDLCKKSFECIFWTEWRFRMRVITNDTRRDTSKYVHPSVWKMVADEPTE